MDTEYRISKARTSLVLDHPFFGCLAMNTGVVITDRPDVPTAGTDGATVYYNSDFVATLTNPELLFVVAHECMHPMLDHLTRCGERDPKIWNIAGDVVINYLLKQEGIGTMPEQGVHMPEVYEACDGITERVYQYLIDNPDKIPEGSGGDPLSGMGDLLEPAGGGSEAEKAELEAKWKVLVSQAARTAKVQGALSAGMERFVGELLAPKVCWQDVLRDFVVKCKTEDRTWARPNRRWIAQGLYLPSITGEAMAPLVVAIDTSGSIGAAELNQFAAELVAIQEDLKPECIHVVYFDHAVCGTADFTPDEPAYLKSIGGGGTAFSPIFRHVEGAGIEPAACVVLTDLCCNDFGPPPEYPVLWVTTAKGTAPWGQIVEM